MREGGEGKDGEGGGDGRGWEFRVGEGGRGDGSEEGCC